MILVTVPPGGVARTYSEMIADLEAGDVYAYGHSYSAGLEATNDFGWADRIAVVAGKTARKRGVTGQVVHQTVVNEMFNGSSVTAWTPGTAGHLFIEAAINDIRRNGQTGNAVAAWKDCLRAGICLGRAGAYVAEGHASVTYNGSWATASVAGTLIGGSCQNSTTPGNYWQITFTGDEITVLTIRLAVGIGTGGQTTITNTAGGATLATVSHAAGMPTGYPTDWSLIGTRITGLGSGSHTIRGTHTGSGGQAVYLDGYLTPSATPPLIYLMKDQLLSAWTTGSNAAPWNQGTDAAVTAYKTAIDQLVAEFTDERVLAVDVASWNKATMLDADGVHPNDLGHSEYTLAAAAVMFDASA